MAERTGLEPATPCVTGRYSNQLNYRSTDSVSLPDNRLPVTGAVHLKLMPGSSLLSHGETPHYHRRYGVSLLSSAWGQVGPPRYRRQANSVSFQPLHSLPVQPPEPIFEQAESRLSKNTFGVVRLSLSGH